MSSVQQAVHPVVRARGVLQRAMFIYALLTIALALVLGMLAVGVLIGPQGGTVGVDQVIRRASTRFVWPWSPRSLSGSLTVDGARLPGCGALATQPPVVLAIDTSRSMQGEPLTTAVRAAEQLARGINVQTFRVGALTFADTAIVLQAPSTQVDSLAGALAGAPSGEDSRISAGVQAAQQLLGSGDQSRFGTLILISDGIGDVSDLAAVTEQLKQQGIRIVVLAVGADADRELLGRIASSPDDVIGPDDTEIARLVHDYSIDSRALAGRDFVLTEQYDRAGFRATGARPVPTSPISEQITWRSYFLPAETQTYSYTLETSGFGLYALAPRGGAVYLDCNDVAVQTPTPAGPYVLVLPPWLPWLLLPLLLLLLAWLVLRFWRLDEPDPRVVVVGLPPVTPPPPLLPPLLDPLPPAVAHAPYGRATPTLVMGIGGSGEAVLQHIHRNVWELTPDGQLPEHLLLLSVDLEQPERDRHLQENLLQPLPDDERLHLSPKVIEIARQFERDRSTFPHLEEWLRIERQISAGEFQATADQASQRQYGRLVLFEHLQQGIHTAALYDAIATRLEQLERQADPNEPIRIFLVASLSGGFSSGVLADVAHLIRKAVESVLGPQRSYTVQPFLIPGGAFATQHSSRSLRANTVATLRELDRLMTLSNRQTLMPYTAREYHEWPASSMLDTLLFDFAFVIDTARNDRTFGDRSLHETLYQAIADAIMLMMDRQANVSLTDYYNQVRAVIRAEQQQTTRAVFNSMGVFSHRVPIRLVAELIECLVLRAMLEQLFGFDYQHGPLSIRQPAEQDVSGRVDDFLRQLAAHPTSGVSLAAFGAMAELLATGPSARFQESFERQLSPGRQVQPNDARAYVDQFTVALQRFVFDLLNGAEASVESRSGRLPLALAAFEQLSTIFRHALRSVSATPQSPPSTTFALAVLRGCAEQAEAFVAELRSWQEYAVARRANSLYEQISASERAVRGQLTMLQRSAVRNYLFEEYLPDLSARFQHAALSQGGRFFWEVAIQTQQTWTPTIALGFVGVGDGSHPPRAGSTITTIHRDMPIEQTLESLRQVARTLVTPLWNESIYAWLERQPDQQASPRNLAEQLLRDTSPFLRYDQLDAPNALKTRFLANAPAQSLAASEYLSRILQRLRSESIRPGELQTIDLTNRFNCMFLNAINVLPIETLGVYSPDGVYRSDYDTLEPRQQQRLHVYAAEQQAVRYEAALVERADVDRRMLHPRVVALLTNPAALELLLLSYAHRLLLRRGADWFLRLEGLPAQQLTDESGDQTLLDALDQALLGKPRRALLDAQSFKPQQAQLLRQTLDRTYTRGEHLVALDAALLDLREQYNQSFQRRSRSPRDRMPEQMHEDLLVLLMVLAREMRDAIAIADVGEEEIRR